MIPICSTTVLYDIFNSTSSIVIIGGNILVTFTGHRKRIVWQVCMSLIHNNVKKNKMDAVVGGLLYNLYGQPLGQNFIDHISVKKEDMDF